MRESRQKDRVFRLKRAGVPVSKVPPNPAEGGRGFRAKRPPGNEEGRLAGKRRVAPMDRRERERNRRVWVWACGQPRSGCPRGCGQSGQPEGLSKAAMPPSLSTAPSCPCPPRTEPQTTDRRPHPYFTSLQSIVECPRSEATLFPQSRFWPRCAVRVFGRRHAGVPTRFCAKFPL